MANEEWEYSNSPPDADEWEYSNAPPDKPKSEFDGVTIQQPGNNPVLNDLLYGLNKEKVASSFNSGPPEIRYRTPDLKSDQSGIATLRGGLQGVSGGWSDEAIGGAEALYDLARNNSKEDFTNLYIKYRDESRAANEAARKEHPGAYNVGQLGGSVLATAAIPGGPGWLAAQGALQAAGTSNAGIQQGENNFGDLALDTTVGGLVGGTIGGLSKAISPAAGKYLSGKAEELAERAAGGTKFGASQFPSGTGRQLLDEGVVSFGDDAASIATKAGEAEKNVLSAQQQRFKDVDPSLMSSVKQPTTPMSQVAKQAADKANKQAETSFLDPSQLTLPGLMAAGGYLHQPATAAASAVGAVGGVAFNKFVAPKLTSSAAVAGDFLSNALQKSPQIFGKFAKPLLAAMQRSGTSLAATSYALAARNPEYKKILEHLQNGASGSWDDVNEFINGDKK